MQFVVVVVVVVSGDWGGGEITETQEGCVFFWGRPHQSVVHLLARSSWLFDWA